MKKLLSALIALVMAVTLFGTVSFAAGDEPAETDPTTFTGYTYEEGARIDPAVWLNAFDADDNCIGNDYVVFNVASSVKKIVIPVFYAGTKAKDQDADVRFEVYAWDTDVQKTLAGTALFTEDKNLDGDHPVELTMTEPLPSGQYLFNVTQLSGRGEWTDGVAHYSVLPLCDLKYSESYLSFGDRGKFAFYIEFEKKDGLDEYFLKLQGDGPELEILTEKTLIARNGDTPHEISEFAILTPVIPDGQVLFSVTLTNSPTWSNTNGDSDVEIAVYKWRDDYDESVSGNPVFETELLDHADNSNLIVKFGSALRYGHRYLIVFTRSNSGRIGFWEGVPDRPEGWEFYDQGEEVEYNPSMKVTYANCGDLGPEPTEAPTQAPTEKPPEVPPTDAPALTDAPATDAPAPTDAPKETDGGQTDKTNEPGGSGDKPSGGNSALPIIICIVCGVIIIGCAVVIVLSKKKKK